MLVKLILALHHFAPRLRDVGRESEQQVLGDALLDRDPGPRVLIITSEGWIDLQARDACQLLDAAAYLASRLGRNHRVGAWAGGVRLLRGLAARNQVDDVSRRQRRIGHIGRRQLIQGSTHGEREVVLLHNGCYYDVHHRMSLVGIVEGNHTALQLVADISIEQLPRCQVGSARDHRIGGGSNHLQRNPTRDANLRTRGIQIFF